MFSWNAHTQSINPRAMSPLSRTARRYKDKRTMSRYMNIIRFCLKFCHRKRASQCISSLNSFLTSEKKKENRKFIPCPPITYERSKRLCKSGTNRGTVSKKHPARTVLEELLNRFDPTQLQNINVLLRQYQVS